MLQEYRSAGENAVLELLSQARLTRGDLLVVGCSTSEVAGRQIGTTPGPEIARALLEGMLPVLEAQGVFLAAQCCEHLNRALILETCALEMHRLTPVNVVPQPKAGGSFATAAWQMFHCPAAVEYVQAAAGLDIGDTLIGMHLRPVAVPVRLSLRKIGEANLVAARTRPKFIGGIRAIYNENLL